MAERSKPQQTRLRITACASVYHGEHPNGHKYTIYEIEAAKPDGTPVEQRLRSFEELPVGEEIDLSVVKYQDESAGISYTLSRRGGSGNAAKIKKLEQVVQDLTARLEVVERMALGHRIGA